MRKATTFARFLASVTLALGACQQATVPEETFTESPAGWEVLQPTSGGTYPYEEDSEILAPDPNLGLAFGETYQDRDGQRVRVLKAIRTNTPPTPDDDEDYCVAILIEQLLPEQGSDPRFTPIQFNERTFQLVDETGYRYSFDPRCAPVGASGQVEPLPAGYANGSLSWLAFPVFDESIHLWAIRADKNNFDIEVAVKVK